MNTVIIRPRVAALAMSAALLIGSASSALAAGVNKVFNGEVVHVSTNNIKVMDPKTHQTLAFTLVPHFNNVFKKDEKTTAQRADLANGQYVKVYYDQKLLGMRHADRIIMISNGNHKLGMQKG